MQIQGMKISIINIISTLAVCLSLISCSKGGGDEKRRGIISFRNEHL